MEKKDMVLSSYASKGSFRTANSQISENECNTDESPLDISNTCVENARHSNQPSFDSTSTIRCSSSNISHQQNRNARNFASSSTYPCRSGYNQRTVSATSTTSSTKQINSRNPRYKRHIVRVISHPQRGYFSAEDDENEIEADEEAFFSEFESEFRNKTLKKKGFKKDYGKNKAIINEIDEDTIGEEYESFGKLVCDNHNDNESISHSIDSEGSFTLKERQDAINKTHPFGIRLWKPALYKKTRSVQKTAEGDIHSTPGEPIFSRDLIGNILWTICFGWWLALVALITSFICYIFIIGQPDKDYSRVLRGLSCYVFYPFGQYVELKSEEAYAEEDEGEGHSISEYTDLEIAKHNNLHIQRIIGRRRDSIDSMSDTESLLGCFHRSNNIKRKGRRRLFGRGQWSFGRIVFFLLFYLIIAPLLLLVSAFCWLIVFAMPMAKVTYLLFDHMRRHPLSVVFHSDFRRGEFSNPTILVCTYRAFGLKYYQYTVDGVNIFFINLMFIVLFTISDEYILGSIFGHNYFITSSATIFVLSLLSIVSLSYLVGMAVASISAQSSIGMGAAINAFFGSVVEVYLYCIALNQGKARLVEGSIVGSVLAGVLLMPGLSMCAGAIRRKTQRFNAKSAGVTSTMLLFAVIGAFAPTLFYQIYGTYELKCSPCSSSKYIYNCQRCKFDQSYAPDDPFYKNSVKPFTYICALTLILSYLIGLWFTLRTHAAMIWQTPITASALDTPKESITSRLIKTPIRESQIFKKIIPKSFLEHQFNKRLNSTFPSCDNDNICRQNTTSQNHPHDSLISYMQDSYKPEDAIHNETNAFINSMGLAMDVQESMIQNQGNHEYKQTQNNKFRKNLIHSQSYLHELEGNEHESNTGHGAPSWSLKKSTLILLTSTLLYSVVAEMLVNTVDVVLQNFHIDEKFLGFTLFALVPNTTEFMNAISFATNGNIALSMEIGSAYALQVCLLQIPCLVAYSAFRNIGRQELLSYTFSLVFPRWDLICVILCVFLLAYVYSEGKSNYFKGSILVLSYTVLLMGYYFTPFNLQNFSTFIYKTNI
ncbi:calcium/proton exchanger [Pneumocystis carinii B80]|uniref:Calcium/proton exchanger n=1 Tax=Pneumocystis carinii (strain B80) TaxID=1408658 RepID=A0A0W4ZI16_PNEC8|nr:calcium/proton exchanger [Pneumocystis carinii B80]KTW28023.1 calcium/proton exchanger [Pneumocystis carinii B80]